MAFIITWNDSFEAIPSDSNYGYDLDTFIQNVKIGVRERAELEHIWKIGATDGQHVPGLVRVIKVDTDANILAYSGKANAIAFATDTKKFYRNTADGANWSVIDIDHGSLSGLTDDDHTIYLLADGTRALTGNLSAGSKKITNLADPTADTDAASKGYVDDQYVPTEMDGVNADDSNTTASASFVDVEDLSISIDINGTSDEIYFQSYINFSLTNNSYRVQFQIVENSTVLALGGGNDALYGHIIQLSGYKTGLSAGTYTLKAQIKSVDSQTITYTYRSLSVIVVRG